MGEPGTGDHLDGGWWPQSRDLAVELGDLVESFPPELGRIVGALLAPTDWDPAPRTPVSVGCLTVGRLPGGDAHLMHLTMADRTVLRVLVVPPEVTVYQGAEALLAAATRGNARTSTSLLETVTEFPAPDPADRWSDPS